MLHAIVFYCKITLYFAWMILSSALFLIYAAIVSPWLWRDQRLGSQYAHFFGNTSLKLLKIKLELIGAQNFDNHRIGVYVGNHQSGLDVALFGGLVPKRVMVVGKKELLMIPLFGQLFYICGSVLIDRSNKKQSLGALDKASKLMLKTNSSMWIFPEGTRGGEEGQLLKFKRGAFYTAIAAQLPICPIVIEPLNPLVSRQQKKFLSGTLRVVYLPPLPTVGLNKTHVDELLLKTRESMQKALTELKLMRQNSND